MGRDRSTPHVTLVVINPVFIQEIPEPRFDLWLDVCHAVLCAEDDMVIESRVGVRHIFCSLGWFNRRYATGKYLAGNRGLKPTAKFIRPLRGGRKRAK
jgi:hypothetical protein